MTFESAWRLLTVTPAKRLGLASGELGLASEEDGLPSEELGLASEEIRLASEELAKLLQSFCRPVCGDPGCYAPPRAQWLGATRWPLSIAPIYGTRFRACISARAPGSVLLAPERG